MHGDRFFIKNKCPDFSWTKLLMTFIKKNMDANEKAFIAGTNLR